MLGIPGRQPWLSFVFCLQHENAIAGQENVFIGRGGPRLPARNWWTTVEMRRHTVTHGRGSEGETGEWSG